MTSLHDSPQVPDRCTSGHAATARFRFAQQGRPDQKCLRHALVHRPIVVTAAATSLVVGTLLTVINQGTLLFQGTFPADLAWKIPLTYCVPYGVATWSALRISRMGRDIGSA